jgi:DNA-binding NtrC family response regulator
MDRSTSADVESVASDNSIATERREGHAPSEARVGILTVDAESGELARASLDAKRYSVVCLSTVEESLAEISSGDIAIVVIDLEREGMSGIDLCRAALERRPHLTVIMLSGCGSVEQAVACMHAGAYDFVAKPLSSEAFALIVERARRHHVLSDELTRLRRRVEVEQATTLVGASACMAHLNTLINRVAESDATVLITGKSGTGKELVARALHDRSGRSGPFLAINCAAVPENLLESELFGHAKGAFTDAHVARSGLFADAGEGTVFLDEIGEMPLGMQAKLLRALQERCARPLGSNKEVAFEARVVVATNRNLEQDMLEKRFRSDLYYRINVVHIEVPALSARGYDVLVLAQHFLDRASVKSNKRVLRIDRDAAERLTSYNWPGNVRELENCIERVVALARSDELTVLDLPPKIREFRAIEGMPIGPAPEDLPSMQLVEERHVQRVLVAVHGNKTLAAKILGVDRRTLYRKLGRRNAADARV